MSAAGEYSGEPVVNRVRGGRGQTLALVPVAVTLALLVLVGLARLGADLIAGRAAQAAADAAALAGAAAGREAAADTAAANDAQLVAYDTRRRLVQVTVVRDGHRAVATAERYRVR